jgi:hypothetical protein
MSAPYLVLQDEIRSEQHLEVELGLFLISEARLTDHAPGSPSSSPTRNSRRPRRPFRPTWRAIASSIAARQPIWVGFDQDPSELIDAVALDQETQIVCKAAI